MSQRPPGRRLRGMGPLNLLRAALRRLVIALTERRLAAFERAFAYDASYLREVVHASPPAFVRFSLFTAFAATREELPADAWFGAKLAATLHEDCGPCTQLVVRMAEQAGVDANVLRALLRRDAASLGDLPAALSFRFAETVMARDTIAADALREVLRTLYGDRGVVALSFAIASSRVYPTVKYALGHGRACERVVVKGEIAPLAPRAPGAPQPTGAEVAA